MNEYMYTFIKNGAYSGNRTQFDCLEGSNHTIRPSKQSGDQGGARTRDRSIRSRILCPTELQGHSTYLIIKNLKLNAITSS